MPQLLLDAKFWQEQFLVPPEAIEAIHSHLEVCGASSSRDLAEIVVRSVLEGQAGTKGFRVYSPEQAYKRGEVIFFHSHDGPRFADVLDVDFSRSQDARWGSFRKMIVRFKSEFRTHTYVTECASFPTRFSGHLVIAGGEAFTPGAIATKFYDSIVASLGEALLSDGRFTLFGQMWMLAAYLVSLDVPLLSRTAQLLREHGQLTNTEIAKQLFPGHTSACRVKATALSVAIGLASDKRKRFVCLGGSDELMWALAPPPKEAAITLTEDCVENGYLPLSDGLATILFYYGLDEQSVVTFAVYGDYRVRGCVDSELGTIGGTEIHQWIAENNLEPGSRVYAKSPASDFPDIRLYTLLEFNDQTVVGPHDRDREKYSKKYLRHAIYSILLQRNQFMHYREIADLVSQGGTPTEPASVAAILSSNSHLFAKREPSRGLWGLKRWDSSGSEPEVSSTSLLLAISEESWIRRILEEEGRPLTGRDIARRLAGLFQVRVEQIRELSFINPGDTELQLLADGRWALSAWVRDWPRQLADIEKKLRRLNQLRTQITELESKVEDWRLRSGKSHSAMVAVREQLGKEETQRKETAARIERVGERLGNLKQQIIVTEEQTQEFDDSASRLRFALISLLVLFVFLTTAALMSRSVIVAAVGAGVGVCLLALRGRLGRIQTEKSRLSGELERARSGMRGLERERTNHISQQRKVEESIKQSAEEIRRLDEELVLASDKLARLSEDLDGVRLEIRSCNETDMMREYNELKELVELTRR
jgi:hypothetical protein